MSFTEIFGGTTIYPSQQSYLALTFSTNQELAWPIEQQVGGNVVADIIDLNATGPGLNVDIPDARQVSTGFTSLFNNVGANTVTIRNATGGTIVSLTSGTAWQIYLTDNSTEAGTWRSFQFGASTSVADAAALAGSGLKAIATTLNETMASTEHAVSYVIVDADRAEVQVWTGGTGTFTLPAAATVGNDWFVPVRNSGSGDLTVSPPSGTIDGAASLTVSAGGSAFVVCDGTNYFTVGSGGSGGGSGFDYVSINVAGAGDYTLSGAELNRVGYNFTGILTGTRNIVVPGAIAEYWVTNSTTGAFSLFIKTAAQAPGIEVLQGDANILYCDGTDVKSAESATVSFPIAVAQGGTGAVNAANARTNLGATTVGSNLFTAASAAAALAVVGGAAAATTLTAGLGLTGGGDLSTNRSFALSFLGLQNLTDPNADRILFWDDSAGSFQWLAPSTGLAISTTNLSLSFLGLQNLTDPNADRIMFWDDSAGTLEWLTPNATLLISTTSIGVNRGFVQRTTDLSRSSTTTPTADTVLVFNGLAAGTYIVEVVAEFGTSSGTQGAIVRFGGTNVDLGQDHAFQTIFTNGGGGASSGDNTFMNNTYATIGTFQPSAAPDTVMNLRVTSVIVLTGTGNIEFQWAQNTSSATATVIQDGSWMTYERIA